MKIVLLADRMDEKDRFRYRLEGSDLETFWADDPDVIAERLKALGIMRPKQLIEQARIWGTVEILAPNRSQSKA